MNKIEEAQARAIRDQKENKRREHEAIQQAIDEWQDANPGKRYRNNPDAGDWITARKDEIIAEEMAQLKSHARLDGRLFTGADDEEDRFVDDFPIPWIETLNDIAALLSQSTAVSPRGYAVLHITGPGDGGVLQLVIGRN